MKRYFATAVLAALLTTACTRPVARPERQFQVPAPQAWIANETNPASDDVNWWAYFQDNGLDTVIREALSCSPTLRAAAARIEAAREQLVIAGAAKVPELTLSANRLRQRQNFIGLPFPGLAGKVLSNTYTNSGLSFNVSWEADLWNRIGAGKMAVTADLQARIADYEAARLSLSGQVAKTWFSAVEARRQVGVAQAALQNAEITAQRIRTRYEAGMRSSLDLRQTLTSVDIAQALVKQREQQLDLNIRQLETLVCNYPAGDAIVAEDLPELPGTVPAGLPSELIHRRPDLVSAERALLATDARIVESRAALRPSFLLTTALGTSSDSLLDLVNPALQIWNLSLGLAQPLFNKGRLKANVRANQARAREAAATYENSTLNAYREVETALAAERTLVEWGHSLASASRNSMAAYQLSEQRYQAGLIDVFTMLSLQRTAFDNESALLELRRARVSNRVDLHLALGGGFKDTPAAIQGPPENEITNRSTQ